MALFFLFVKEVRTQLLDIEEKTHANVKTMDINEEMRIKKRQCHYTSPLSRYHLLSSLYSLILSRTFRKVSVSSAARTDKANNAENNCI